MSSGFRTRTPTVGAASRTTTGSGCCKTSPGGREVAVQGRFVLLDAGDNKHADALQSLLCRGTDAQVVLDALRRQRPGCVRVVNTDILTAEPGAGEVP